MAATFTPRAILDLEPSVRARIASEPRLMRGWQDLERQRCIDDVLYFSSAYGSVEPPVGGAVPFDLWPFQEKILAETREHEIEIVLKARRLGMTWVYLHDIAHLALLDPAGIDINILILCKTFDDSKKILRRLRRLIERLPEWLAPEIEAGTTELRVPSRNVTVTAMTGTEEAARSVTAAYVLWDEAAFPQKGVDGGELWAALEPVIEGGGRLRAISTGNGRRGQGKQFAKLVEDAMTGRSDNHCVFVAWHERPDRSQEWYDRKLRAATDEVLFRREYAADVDEALAEHTDSVAYKAAHLAAAEALGREIADLLDDADPWLDGYEIGIDWGDIMTAALYAVPLPTSGGGVFIVDEEILRHTEPRMASEAILDKLPTGAPEQARIRAIAADAAPAGTNATFASTLEAREARNPRRFPDEYMRVPFSKFKEGGNEKSGVHTVAYIRWLLRNTAEGNGGPRLAVHPRCRVLRKHLRDLQLDDKGKIKKPTADRSDPFGGDHAADALVALLAERALDHQAMTDEE